MWNFSSLFGFPLWWIMTESAPDGKRFRAWTGRGNCSSGALKSTPARSDKAFPLNFPAQCTSFWFMLHNSYQLWVSKLNYESISPADKAVVAIKCYECTVHPRRQSNGTAIERLCAKFEESEQFEVNCPYSTMCKKRLYRYQLINKVQESVERGCADQKNDSMVRVRFRFHIWQCKLTAFVAELRKKQMGQGGDGGRALHRRLHNQQRWRLRVLPLSGRLVQFRAENRSQIRAQQRRRHDGCADCI